MRQKSVLFIEVFHFRESTFEGVPLHIIYYYLSIFQVTSENGAHIKVSSRNFTLGGKLTDHVALGPRKAKSLALKYPKLVLNYSLHVITCSHQRGEVG